MKKKILPCCAAAVFLSCCFGEAVSRDIRLEAENFSSDGGGSVAVRSDKPGTCGKSISHRDDKWHVINCLFDAPAGEIAVLPCAAFPPEFPCGGSGATAGYTVPSKSPRPAETEVFLNSGKALLPCAAANRSSLRSKRAKTPCLPKTWTGTGSVPTVFRSGGRIETFWRQVLC